MVEVYFSKEIEKKQRKETRTRRRRSMDFGKIVILSLIVGQSLVGVEAASENARYRSGQMIRMTERTEVNAAIWEQADPKILRQEERQDR